MELIEELKRNKKLLLSVLIVSLLVESVRIFTPESTKNALLYALNDEWLMEHVFPCIAEITAAGIIVVAILIAARFAIQADMPGLDSMIGRIIIYTIVMPFAFVAYTAILVVFKTQLLMFKVGLIFGVMILLALVWMIHLDIRAAVNYVRCCTDTDVTEGKKELKFTK